MNDCAVPVLGALTALVAAVGGVVVAYSKVLTAEAKLERAIASSKRRDAALVSALKLRPADTPRDIMPSVLAKCDAGGAVGWEEPVEAPDTALLDDIARVEGWEE